MGRDPLASGDPLAERRFAYARAAADQGDFRAAAEVLEQALERAPDWAAAWFALGWAGSERRRWAVPVLLAGLVPLVVGCAIDLAKFNQLFGFPASEQLLKPSHLRRLSAASN